MGERGEGGVAGKSCCAFRRGDARGGDIRFDFVTDTVEFNLGDFGHSLLRTIGLASEVANLDAAACLKTGDRLPRREASMAASSSTELTLLGLVDLDTSSSCGSCESYGIDWGVRGIDE